jgi:hypothetical protein
MAYVILEDCEMRAKFGTDNGFMLNPKPDPPLTEKEIRRVKFEKKRKENHKAKVEKAAKKKEIKKFSNRVKRDLHARQCAFCQCLYMTTDLLFSVLTGHTPAEISEEYFPRDIACIIGLYVGFVTVKASANLYPDNVGSLITRLSLSATEKVGRVPLHKPCLTGIHSLCFNCFNNYCGVNYPVGMCPVHGCDREVDVHDANSRQRDRKSGSSHK